MNKYEIKLNEFAVDALRTSAKWCMFLSIVGFIFIALMLLGGIFFSFAMATVSQNPEMGMAMSMNPMAGLMPYFGLLYIVFALIYFFPVYYLFNYAKGTKEALESGNEEKLAKAIVNLKSHHKFLGIMTIVMIGLYILTIIGFIIFAAKFASAGMH